MVENQARSYANLFGIGMVTGGSIVARLKPEEFMAISVAAHPPEDATEEQLTQAAAINQLIAGLQEMGLVSVQDPRVVSGLQMLVEGALLTPERAMALSAYRRPEPLFPEAPEAPEEAPAEEASETPEAAVEEAVEGAVEDAPESPEEAPAEAPEADVEAPIEDSNTTSEEPVE
jgi:hypothetical protein